MSNVSDYSDPELDELEPYNVAPKPRPVVVTREITREVSMTDQTQAPYVAPSESTETAPPETKPVDITGPVNIKGVAYNEGDVVMLTEEEYTTLTELKAPVKGVEPLKPEEAQTKHEEAVEEQKKVIEQRKKAAAEKEARDEAYEDGEEFNEEEWSAEYDRQQKLVNEDYEPPAKEEEPQSPTS